MEKVSEVDILKLQLCEERTRRMAFQLEMARREENEQRDAMARLYGLKEGDAISPDGSIKRVSHLREASEG